jgi:uncharacterized integral membrane protein
MLILSVLTVLAMTVAVLAVQNAHEVTVSFLFWQFEVPVALLILGATVAGLVIGGVVGFAPSLRRWTRREARPEPQHRGDGDPPRAARTKSVAQVLAEVEASDTGIDPTQAIRGITRFAPAGRVLPLQRTQKCLTRSRSSKSCCSNVRCVKSAFASAVSSRSRKSVRR